MQTHSLLLTRRPDSLGVKGLPTGSLHRVVAARRPLELLEVEDQHFHTDSAVLLPEGQEPTSDAAESSTRRTGIAIVTSALSYGRRNPQKRMLVTGNTDTKGAQDYNVELSAQRARCVHALIVGDRDTFRITCAGRCVLDDKRQILAWAALEFGWPCDPAACFGDSYLATCAFQKAYNVDERVGTAQNKPLIVDGAFGPLTWGAVYDCYEYQMARDLGTDVAGLGAFRACVRWAFEDRHWVSCGEYNPIDNRGVNEYRSLTNRRVEIIFFRLGHEPYLPCREGECRIQSCDLDDSVCYARKHLPVTPGISRDGFWIIRVEKDQGLAPEDTVRIQAGCGYTETVAAARAGDKGSFLEFLFFPGPEDDYDVTITLGGTTYAAWNGLHLPDTGQGEESPGMQYGENQEEPDAYALVVGD